MDQMFCYQCEQTAKGSGCTVGGVCGKNPQVAALQDMLTYAVIGLGQVAHAARQKGVIDPEVDRFVCAGLFATLTNVDFDPDRFVVWIGQAVALRKALAQKAGVGPLPGPASFEPAADVAGLEAQSKIWGFAPLEGQDPDARSLIHLTIFGLRGVAAYADHAAILGQEDPELYAQIHAALAATQDTTLGAAELTALALKVGEINLRAMELLDAGNTGRFGHPVPTSVPLGHKAGKAILVSGHDLEDLAQLLEQSAGKGIFVYTHGEMLPTHGYPELKKHPHFYGHYGTAWQNQGKEFPEFPGAILMTTNCIQRPKGDTGEKIFTTGLVGWPGVPHIAEGPGGKKDFGPVIEKALALPGFAADEDKGSVMVGFARNAVLGVADKIIEAVKSGAIKHFFLVAGCDGAKPGRNYYTEFVEKTPADTVVLTLACGKFRFFDKNLGDIGGIPRLLDVGQCNDAYSAIQIAVALAGAFNCGVNDLPLSMVLSWYEQKACAILLTLLHLGIKGIRLGPSLPAFISPNVLKVLVDNFDIKPISASADEDLKAILG
ncbi:hybrid cluster protein [Desulfarculus baarsii DSM 2075]|uniref:Hydroxylamine reductase n=2 Tax=Desulfarculus baarsii TaxID=453230 RepID=E1QDL0_DESB2|nr:hydroxylamine reductase [Desulfarculus baarsii]ADK83529.1 hybrid cluster protein [Desulfarculus baarsii DSM 2075]